ncbi:MAG: transposase [Planctomycetota bacterium]
MTECNTKYIRFSRVNRKSLLADFTGEHITSDAGALLLREADKRLGLTEALAKCVTDPREQDQIIHSVRRMLRQRIYGIALGYEDLNDHSALRKDEIFKLTNSKALLNAAITHLKPTDSDALRSLQKALSNKS